MNPETVDPIEPEPPADVLDLVCPGEIPAQTRRNVERWFESYLEAKYPGTRWRMVRKNR